MMFLCSEVYEPSKYLDLDRIFFEEEFTTGDAVDCIMKDNRVHRDRWNKQVAPPLKTSFVYIL